MATNSQAVQLSMGPTGVTTLTLDRPEVHNAFDDHLIAELTHKLRDLDHNPAVRAVVLAARGKSFSAGADLNWMKRVARYSEAENIRDAVALASLMCTLDAMTKPTIARVQGAAFGGGVGLVACCDIAVASTLAACSPPITEMRALGHIHRSLGP